MLIIIGVLALQGSFQEHIEHLDQLFKDLENTSEYDSKYQFKSRKVKTVEDLENLSGLILPGGESTTISILLQRNRMLEPIKKLIQVSKLPCWGTCAGLILLSNVITNTKTVLGDGIVENAITYKSIGGLDVQVRRNSFGRQVDSFAENFVLKQFDGDLQSAKFNCVFIRAPVIEKIVESPLDTKINDQENGIVYADKLKGSQTQHKPQILLKIRERTKNELIVAVKQDNIFGTSFHPELVDRDYRMHKWFIDEFIIKRLTM